VLPEAEVSAEETAGTSVNPPGRRADRPPPGWPEDDREFAPGEGPRREDDFLLHIAPFPIFVLPPQAWEGQTMLGGHGGHGSQASYVPTRIEFEYLDRAGEPSRGLQVVSVHPEEEDRLEALYPPHREEGVWWFDAGDDAAYLPQLYGTRPLRVGPVGAIGGGDEADPRVTSRSSASVKATHRSCPPPIGTAPSGRGPPDGLGQGGRQ
jgi:hypothetical protein